MSILIYEHPKWIAQMRIPEGHPRWASEVEIHILDDHPSGNEYHRCTDMSWIDVILLEDCRM